MTAKRAATGDYSLSDGRPRCSWVRDVPLDVQYHDEEWGVPVHDDRLLFELLTLEGAQAGLSWLTVLQRRAGYQRVFKKFNPRAVAKFDDGVVAAILGDEGVIRHRQKIESVVNNAHAVLEMQKRHGSLGRYLWGLGTAEGESVTVSKSMSKQLKKDGFKFVGPTICHSLRQASGMVNDHSTTCFRQVEIKISGRK